MPEQKLDLVRACACEPAGYESPKRISVPYFGLRLLGLALNRAAQPLTLVYGARFKEMKRDEESIRRNRHVSNAYSQLVRQTAK